ncbi:MAG: penicillin-binding protein 1C [Betaproteobacteria bacterium]
MALCGKRWKIAGALAGAAALALVVLRVVPHAPLAAAVPRSTAIYAEGGELMRLTLAADDQYRLWIPLAAMSSRLPEAVLLYEDRWYYWHPGVNPVALVRSAVATLAGGSRQGGSTITMQLARRLYRIDSRSVPGKVAQIGAALWLEARFSKREILEAYLNVAPYGGNVEGVGAASLVYFGKRAQDLTLPEVLALAVIPQNPRRRLALHRPEAPQQLPVELAVARTRLWEAWRARHPADGAFAADLALPLAPRSMATLPFAAPHLTDLLQRQRGRAGGEIRASVDLGAQRTVERILHQYVERNRAVGIRNAAALLVDTSTMQVKALVGSADWFDPAIDGQVDGVLAKRSPGSALKPFIYALALDQGVLHPLTVLKDAPTAFGPFSPENFDGRFVGPITAQDALVRSRNVPAVAVAAKLSRPGLYDFLQSAGVSKMASERHYGLALALGGGEVTMEELARLYAMLANEGVLRPLAYTVEVPRDRQQDVRLLSDEAAFVTLDMLRRNPRPDTGEPARVPVAWKTGTSWGFRDAWTAGVFGRYALVVWIGNFDGSGNPAFVGVKAAAPLFFQIVDALRAQKADARAFVRRQPAHLAKVEVCAATGDLPNEWCRERATTWFLPGKSPIRISTLHRPVLVDVRTGEAVCGDGPTTRREIHEFWPSDLERLFREAGMPRRAPPPLPDCASDDAAVAGDAPQITSPLRGVTYTIRLSQPTTMALRANRTGQGALYWFANQGFVGRADSGDGLAWSPPQPGRYVLRAVDDRGRADNRDVDVEFVP